MRNTRRVMQAIVDFELKETIRNWGLPEYLQKYGEDIQYRFDDEACNDTGDSLNGGYHTNIGSAKFCLFLKSSSTNVFTMDFFKPRPKNIGDRNEVWLELIWVRIDSFRNKGIASFYMNRLIEYAIEEKVDCIRLRAIADADDFEGHSLRNALNQEQLEKFYRSFISEKMNIIVETIT